MQPQRYKFCSKRPNQPQNQWFDKIPEGHLLTLDFMQLFLLGVVFGALTEAFIISH